MKKYFIISLFISFLGAACDTNRDQMEDRQDTGITPERNYEKAEGDTTVENRVNATGNAESGPVEGP